MLSGVSKDSFEEERGVTCTDIKLIMPTVLILLFTLFIMVTVIPYAFSSVIKQLQAVWALEEQCESKPDLPSTVTKILKLGNLESLDFTRKGFIKKELLKSKSL